jgi:hypothetical protein
MLNGFSSGATGEIIMAKADEFISPANLWGRPLPGKPAKPAATKEKKPETGMRKSYEDEDVAEETVDVEAELEANDEEAYAEAAEYEDESGEDIRETADELTDDEEESETEYAPEEGDEEEVGDAVVAEDDVETDESVSPVRGTKRKGAENMAAKKSGADHIREEIERRQEAGDSLRGVDIVAALAKKRVTVSPAQVSQLLKKSGVKPAKAGRAVKAPEEEKSRIAARGKTAVAPVTAPRAAPKKPVTAATGSAAMPMTQLKAAATFLEACDGCYDTAASILKTHQQLGQMWGR